MSIRARLLLGISVLSIVVLGLAIVASYQVGQLARLADDITARSMQRVVFISQINTNLVQWRGLNLSIMLTENPLLRQEYQKQLLSLIKDTETIIQQYNRVIVDPVRRADYEAFLTHINSYNNHSTEMEHLLQRGEVEAAKALFTRTQAPFDETLFHIGRVRSDEIDSARQASQVAAATVDSTRLFFLSVTVFLVAWLVGLTLYMWRSLSAGLRHILIATHRVAQGDLTQPVVVGGRDEFRQLATAFNTMMSSLNNSYEENRRLTQEAMRLQEERINILKSQFSQIVRAQEDERKRISRDLHDETVQMLVGLSRHLDVILSQEKNLPPHIKASLEEIWKMTNQTLQGVRRFSQDLRPSVIDDLGLVPALEWLADRIGNHYPIKVQVQLQGSRQSLPSDGELALFRIVQEALNNVIKHSGASHAIIKVAFSEDKVAISIDDNGRGFQVAPIMEISASQGQLGLLGMRERASLLQGKLEIYSQPGQGTTISVEVPLAQPAFK